MTHNKIEDVYGSKVVKILTLVEQGGTTDGAHHKQWYLDQIARTILNEQDYQIWRYRFVEDDGYYSTDHWDEGIAP